MFTSGHAFDYKMVLTCHLMGHCNILFIPGMCRNICSIVGHHRLLACCDNTSGMMDWSINVDDFATYFILGMCRSQHMSTHNVGTNVIGCATYFIPGMCRNIFCFCMSTQNVDKPDNY